MAKLKKTYTTVFEKVTGDVSRHLNQYYNKNKGVLNVIAKHSIRT